MSTEILKCNKCGRSFEKDVLDTGMMVGVIIHGSTYHREETWGYDKVGEIEEIVEWA